MPFWRSSPPTGEEPAPRPSQPEPIVGTRPCSEHECERVDAAICVYVDRRGRPCDTAWCPDHQVVIASTCYCRRHAGIVRALMTDAGFESKGLPDIDNRAPSLVNWVANGVSDKVERLLLDMADVEGGEQVRSDIVHSIKAEGGQMVWARSWQIYDTAGVRLRVAVEVEEANDTIPTVRVGGRAVFQQVPPWIENRATGAHPSALEDFAERRTYYQDLIRAITTSLNEDGS